MGIINDIKCGVVNWGTTLSARMRYSERRWTVLYFHEVNEREAFRVFLESLQSFYKIVPLKDGFEMLKSQDFRKPLLSLTFDDADRTVYENCLPVLRSHAVVACLFVCTNFVEKGFRDTSTGRYQVMSWDQISQWADAGMEIGAHTVNHVPLNQATFDRAKWEILESRRILEGRLGCPVRHFAYPWGHFKDQLDEWLQEDGSFDTISTTFRRDNYPDQHVKRVYRKAFQHEKDLRSFKNLTLYESIREVNQRSVLNGLAPVVFRIDESVSANIAYEANTKKSNKDKESTYEL